MIYLTALTISLCLSYFAIMELFWLFFEGKHARPNSRAVISITVILAATVLGYLVAFNLPDKELGNRILHGFVGGFLTFAICFLAAKDSGLRVGSVRFMVASFLIVIALGVLNEHVEYLLQTYVRVLFYSNPYDTWLDLISNTIGAAIAALIFMPMIWRYKLLS